MSAKNLFYVMLKPAVHGVSAEQWFVCFDFNRFARGLVERLGLAHAYEDSCRQFTVEQDMFGNLECVDMYWIALRDGTAAQRLLTAVNINKEMPFIADWPNQPCGLERYMPVRRLD